MTKLYLFTHASTNSEKGHDVYHHHLNSAGRKQAEDLAEHLPSLSCLFSSSYRSAIETTYIIAAALGVIWKPLQQHVPFLLKETAEADSVDREEKTAAFFQHRNSIELGEDTAVRTKELIKNSIYISLSQLGNNQNAAVVASSFQLALYAEEFSHQDTLTLWKKLEAGEMLTINLLTGQLEDICVLSKD